jgi:hypothetical protein
LFLIFIIATFLSACAANGGMINSKSENVSKLNASMLGDMPLPKDARIVNENSLVLGEGESWVGRLEILCPYSTSDAVAFFIDQYPQAGWTLLSASKSKNSILVFTNAKKSATLEITEGSALSMASKITITVSPINTAPSVQKKKP